MDKSRSMLAEMMQPRSQSLLPGFYSHVGKTGHVGKKNQQKKHGFSSVQ